MNTEKKLLELINAELNLCTGKDTPYVCAMYHSENKETLVKTVYNYVTKQNLFIADAIAEVEKEYNSNY
jgi:hypothetical protein